MTLHLYCPNEIPRHDFDIASVYRCAMRTYYLTYAYTGSRYLAIPRTGDHAMLLPLWRPF